MYNTALVFPSTISIKSRARSSPTTTKIKAVFIMSSDRAFNGVFSSIWIMFSYPAVLNYVFFHLTHLFTSWRIDLLPLIIQNFFCKKVNKICTLPSIIFKCVFLIKRSAFRWFPGRIIGDWILAFIFLRLLCLFVNPFCIYKKYLTTLRF